MICLIYLIASSFTNGSSNNTSVTGAEDLAKCLTEKGAKLYGASWCPHCQNQKALFGDAVESLPYVECTEKAQECAQAGITAYPTWIIDGQSYSGGKTFAELKSYSGC